MSKNTWKGMDPDDVAGYLVDHIATWQEKMNLKNADDERLYDRLYNMEDDDKVDFIGECMKAIEAMNA